ncbi:GNAT family N-acetyltransferase [Streptomyces kanamyceticus]|uniref:N-acetyltransferase n=1 Tax=Streptomyces kanamyceticus TaxID=1967 RepID=A0A5J6GQV0_STRKN|nr:GNAT family N-acetyltransferase [Streptomyces kanamyceticus]QEU96521.1 N-acetyltransferase [Streptomyces kanamyceticus]
MSPSSPGPALAPDRIRTARLDLVPLRVEHAEEMAAVLGDPALHAFIGGAPDDVAALRARYRRMLAGSPEPEVSWLNWVVRLRTGQLPCLVGTVQATVTPGGPGGGPAAEIAWVIGTPWQGRGFASEAARGLVDWLTAQRAVRTLVAHVHPGHGASAAVARAVRLTATDVVQDGEIRWELTVEGRVEG